jgi:hypothetical protein
MHQWAHQKGNSYQSTFCTQKRGIKSLFNETDFLYQIADISTQQNYLT